MELRRLTLAIILMLLVIPLSAQAVTYWVSATGGTGTDTTPCSSIDGPTDPGVYRRSVIAGATCMAPGDTLMIKPGTYTEDFVNCQFHGQWGCWPSGSAGSPTIVKAQTPRSVTLRNADAVFRENVIYLENRHHITFDGLKMDGGGPFPTHLALFRTNGNVNNIILDNVEIYSTTPAAQSYPPPNLILGDCDSCSIINSSLHDNDTGGSTCGNCPVQPCDDTCGPYRHGIYGLGDDMILDNNEIYNISGTAIHYHHECFPVGTSDRATITRNIIHHTGMSGSGAAMVFNSAVGPSLIANNILYSNPLGIYGFWCSSGTFSIYNNTLYSNSAGINFNGDPQSGSPTLVVRNNIINQSSTPFSDSWCPGSPGCPAGGATRFTTGGGTADHNLCTATGLGCDLPGNPGFISAAGGDFHIAAAGSPAVNAGVNLTSTGLTTDADGVARPSGVAPWEVGAYEFGAGVTYWVGDNEGFPGNCGNAQGTSPPAFFIRTILSGQECMSAGDTLMVMPGVYTENWNNFPGGGRIVPSGSLGNPTIVKSFTQYAATLRHSNGGLGSSILYFDKFSHDITVDGFRIDGSTDVQFVVYMDAWHDAQSHRITIQNNDIFKNNAGPVGQLVLEGCLAHDHVYRNNLMHDNGNPTTDDFGGAHAFYMEGTNSVMDGNTVYSISGYGFHIHADDIIPPDPRPNCYNNIIRPVMINNIIRNTGTSGFGGSGIICSSCNGAFIANNIVYNNPQCGIQLYYNMHGTIEVYNNTTYNNNLRGVSGIAGICHVGGPTNAVTVARNNISQGNGGSMSDTWCPGSSGCPASGNRFTGSPNASSNNLCNATGSGCTLTGNAGFVSVAGGNEDFRLATAGSAAVNQGVNLTSTGLTTDADGVARPSGVAAWEVGAYEFGVTEPPQPDPVNLLAYWPLDTGSGLSAFEALGHTGTLDIAAWASPGIIGPSSFAPTGTQEITVSNVTGFNTPNSCSLVALINMTTTDTQGCSIVSDHEGCAMYLSPTGLPECWIYTTQTPPQNPVAQGTVSVLNTGPRMISCTYDATESGAGIRTYVDTSQVALTPLNATIFYGLPSGAFRIGRDGAAYGGYQCRGVIDEVRRYQGRLPAQAIQNLFSQFVAQPGMSLVHTIWTAANTTEGSFLSAVDSDLSLTFSGSLIVGLRSALHNATGSSITEYFRTYARVFTTSWGAWTEVTNSFGSLGIRYLNPNTAVNLGGLTTPLLPLDAFIGVTGKFIADVVDLTSPYDAAQQITFGHGQHAEHEVRLELGAPLVATNLVQIKLRRESGADLNSYGGPGDPLVKTLTLQGIAPPSSVQIGVRGAGTLSR